MYWFNNPNEFKLINSHPTTKTIHLPTSSQIIRKQIRLPSNVFEHYYAQMKWRKIYNQQSKNKVFPEIMCGKLLRQDCQSKTALIGLYIEKMEYRLCDVKSISTYFFVQILVQLLPCIKACMQRFGRFLLTDKMIFVCNNQWKMWINEKIQESLPQLYALSNTDFYIVHNILQVFEAKMIKQERQVTVFNQAFRCKNIDELIRLVYDIKLKSHQNSHISILKPKRLKTQCQQSEKIAERGRNISNYFTSQKNLFPTMSMNNASERKIIDKSIIFSEKSNLKISFNYRHSENSSKIFNKSKIMRQNEPLKMSQTTMANKSENTNYTGRKLSIGFKNLEHCLSTNILLHNNKQNLQSNDSKIFGEKNNRNLSHNLSQAFSPVKSKKTINLDNAKLIESSYERLETPQQEEEIQNPKTIQKKFQFNKDKKLLSQLIEASINTNKSINLGGEEIYDYLKDVKLQYLDKIGTNLAVSVFEIDDQQFNK